ncbi:MAG: RDD family protein [Sulfurospirillum sp.]|nr:RDD family protein [Sulfurospirillum sp.]
MRWRDVRHGKIEPQKIQKKALQNFTIAPIKERFKAFITDTFMLLMPLIYIVFYLIMGSREAFSESMLLGWIYIFVPHALFILSFWFFKGQTPGYKAYKIKLVSWDLSKPTLTQLFVRYITFALSTILVTGIILGFLRKDKKNMHDILSGTMPIIIES